MLEISRMSGLQRALLALPIMVAMGSEVALATSDGPEPIEGKIDGPNPFGRGDAVAVISDGPDPISAVVRLPTPGEAINDNPDSFHAAIGDGPDPVDPIAICVFDDGFDCVFLARGQSALVTPLQP